MSNNIIEKIKKARPNLKESSIKTYITSINKIKKKINDDSNVTNLDFLKDIDKIIKVIDDENKITNKKNLITSVLVLMQLDNKSNKKNIELLNEKLKKLSEEYLATLKEQKKTETQEKNWINYKDIIKIINTITKNIKEMKLSEKNELNNKEFDKLQQYLILRSYLSFQLRNDYADMKIIKKKEYDKINSKEKNLNNYLVIFPNKQKKFYINNFKNVDSLGSKILDIDKKLNNIINLWLKFNKSGWYLVKKDRKNPMNPNNITKYLNKIFKNYADGKKISSSMLRHIIISHKLKNAPSLKEKEKQEEEVKKKFMHSDLMHNLYRKI